MTNKILLLGILIVLLAGCTTNSIQVEPERKSSGPTAPYNTAGNQGERNGMWATSGDQGENTADREITAKIHIAVVSDGSLSLNAQNVQIITTNGMVTLYGPVESPAEKAAIEDKAWQVAGVVQISNQLEVTTQ